MILWEQEPALVSAGILAVFADDIRFLQSQNLTLLAGEVEGVDTDTTVGGVIRVPALTALWKERRQVWEEDAAIDLLPGV